MQLNQTHNPAAQSWLACANSANTDFPIQNLPFAVFRRAGAEVNGEAFRGGVAIGDQIIDCAALAKRGVFQGAAQAALNLASQPSLNALMNAGGAAWSALRLSLFQALEKGSALQAELEACLIPQALAEYAVPAQIGDYTDFYTSIHHATNIGKLFRPDNPLLPNYQWVPIGYHGRASSIRASGQGKNAAHAFKRPVGQIMPAGAMQPILAPCKRLDYELELGIFIGGGNRLGEPISIETAENHIFGFCLLNDWSARDIQAWEYQPLGPFLSKSFASTISPWIVTLEALAPYRAAFTRAAGEPQPLPYLSSAANTAHGAFNIEMQVNLTTAKGGQAQLSHSNYLDAYWTPAQLVAHHTVNGCNLQSGDFFGTGTLSGPKLENAAALIELTSGGKNPITLPNGETRTFLEDGDTVTLTAHCAAEGAARIGFGICAGTVLASS